MEYRALVVGLLLLISVVAADGQNLETLSAEEIAGDSELTRRLLERFSRLDSDEDGRLSGDEITRLSEILESRKKRKNQNAKKAVNRRGLPATYSNVSYGPHPRNLFDIWLAESAVPTPLVIFIHGGGFVGGDKSKIYDSADLVTCLDAGVSFATINYRFRNEEPKGIQASLKDSSRCLQFIRTKAVEWNLDKNRIACYGGSAGAGTSLWLAFHDDLADPKSDDLVLRESSRISVAGATGAQATYDLLKWPAILQMEDPGESAREKSRAQMAGALGLKSVQELDSEKSEAIRRDLDMLALMSADDPPFFVYNRLKGHPPKWGDKGHINHHPLHAKALMERAEEVGVEAHIEAPGLGIRSGIDPEETLVEFILRHLDVTPQR